VRDTQKVRLLRYFEMFRRQLAMRGAHGEEKGELTRDGREDGAPRGLESVACAGEPTAHVAIFREDIAARCLDRGKCPPCSDAPRI
jgi:hypothetical protein